MKNHAGSKQCTDYASQTEPGGASTTTDDFYKNVTYAKAGTGTTHTSAEVSAAAGELYDWLKKESVLRAFMSYMAGSGVYFAASAQERGLCCFVNAGHGSKDQCVRAMQSRTSSPSSSPSKSNDDALAQLCGQGGDGEGQH